MLDKSIPFHTIILKRPFGPAPALRPLPEGFTLRAYQPGDEQGWAQIEQAVGEFDTVEQALHCHRGYQNQPEELRRRQWYAIAPNGDWAATATAWWTINAQGKRIPVVHALGCEPKCQGLGLGRAVATAMLNSFYRLENGLDVWLDTQTWSYRAIGLYLELGFVPVKTATYNETPNEYDLALPILESRMRPELFERFVKTTVDE